jgi:hypothetical protein
MSQAGCGKNQVGFVWNTHLNLSCRIWAGHAPGLAGFEKKIGSVDLSCIGTYKCAAHKSVLSCL